MDCSIFDEHFEGRYAYCTDADDEPIEGRHENSENGKKKSDRCSSDTHHPLVSVKVLIESFTLVIIHKRQLLRTIISC